MMYVYKKIFLANEIARRRKTIQISTSKVNM